MDRCKLLLLALAEELATILLSIQRMPPIVWLPSLILNTVWRSRYIGTIESLFEWLFVTHSYICTLTCDYSL